MTWLQPEPHNWWKVVDDAYAEDIGTGDVSAVSLPESLQVRWTIEAQAEGILCGTGIAEYLLAPGDDDSEESYMETHLADGARVAAGQAVVGGYLPARRVMEAERTALNFLMHLSGVATLTGGFVQAVEGTRARIVDTRKTLPNLRALQKYAVRCGGGHNHRMGLYDGAMIKDNHIAAAGSIGRAVETLRRSASHMTKIEVECESLEQVGEAVDAGADVVLLDNMDPTMMREAVQRFEGRCLFEASGGINLDTVRAVAESGVHLISVGAITHSAPALALHLELE